MAIVLVLIAAIAVIGAVVAGTRQTPVPAGSPEAALQGYLEAVIDGDSVAAAGYLDPGSKCKSEDLDRFQITNVAEVRLVDVKTTGSTSKISVDLHMGNNSMMSNMWRDRQSFQMKRINGEWFVTGTPWPMYECGGVLK